MSTKILFITTALIVLVMTPIATLGDSATGWNPTSRPTLPFGCWASVEQIKKYGESFQTEEARLNAMAKAIGFDVSSVWKTIKRIG
jgi:hypothetical protein